MPLYIVRVEEITYHHVKVRADSEETAKAKAEDGVGVGIDLVKSNVVGVVVGEIPPEEEIKK